MTEAQLLSTLAAVIEGDTPPEGGQSTLVKGEGDVAEPEIDPTPTIPGVTNLAQKIFIKDTTKDPQTGDIFMFYYYVKNRGEETEEAFASEIRNHAKILEALNLQG